MTTRILSSRALRLVVASLLVAPLLVWRWAGDPYVLLPVLVLCAVVVGTDRRWFVPATLLVLGGWFIWPRPFVMYQLDDGSRLTVHRLTGAVDRLPSNRDRTAPDWLRTHPSGEERLTPIPIPRPR